MDVIGMVSCSEPLQGRISESGAIEQPFVPKGSYRCCKSRLSVLTLLHLLGILV